MLLHIREITSIFADPGHLGITATAYCWRWKHETDGALMSNLRLEDGTDTHAGITLNDVDEKMIATARALEAVVPPSVKNDYPMLQAEQVEQLREHKSQLVDTIEHYSQGDIEGFPDNPEEFWGNSFLGSAVSGNIVEMGSIVGETDTDASIQDVKSAVRSMAELKDTVLGYVIHHGHREEEQPLYDRQTGDNESPSTLQDIIREVDRYTDATPEGIETRRKLVTVALSDRYDTPDIDTDYSNPESPVTKIGYFDLFEEDDISGQLELNLKPQAGELEVREMRRVTKDHVLGNLKKISSAFINQARESSDASESMEPSEVPEPFVPAQSQVPEATPLVNPLSDRVPGAYGSLDPTDRSAPITWRDLGADSASGGYISVDSGGDSSGSEPEDTPAPDRGLKPRTRQRETGRDA